MNRPTNIYFGTNTHRTTIYHTQKKRGGVRDGVCDKGRGMVRDGVCERRGGGEVAHKDYKSLPKNRNSYLKISE